MTPPAETQVAALPQDAAERTIHLDGDIYTSPEIARLEQGRIFSRAWLCAARAEEAPRVGDYLTLTVAGESVVLARSAPDTIVAYRNICLHRGAELVQGCGNAQRLTCPYHAWTYAMDGRLIGAPRVEAAAWNVADRRLPAVRAALWRGWVFINLDPDGAPFEDFIAQWEQELWYYQAGRCRLAFKTETEFACNWKYVVENVMDFYHAQTVHFASFGKQFDFSSGPLPLRRMADGGVSVQFDTKGRINDPPVFPLLPWLAPRPDFAAGKAAVFPNMNLFSNTDSLRTSTFWPVSEDRMKLVLYFLLPEEFFALPDFETRLEHYRKQVRTIAEEDRIVLESLQRNSRSAHLAPGPIVDLEAGIRHMQDHYMSVVGLG